MAKTLTDVDVLSVLLCLDLVCLSIAVWDRGIVAGTEKCLVSNCSGAFSIPPTNGQTAMLDDMTLHD